MEVNIKLGRFLGIPVGLHWSWFIIFIMITWSLVGMYTLIETPRLPQDTAWIVAIFTSLLFFASVLFHEFGHAVIALRNDIPVRSISLFLFGGAAQIGQEPETPGAEFRIAIAGPLASLLLAGFFTLIHWGFADIPVIENPALWLARINLLLAGFNMIPGFPLDGGRVFRAILWQYSKSFSKANKIASMGGQIVALCFIVYGIFAVFRGNTLSGIWMAFIGWYLNTAATGSQTPTLDNPILTNIKVSQVMDSDTRSVPASMSLNQLITELFVPHGIDMYTVTDAGKPVGVLSMQNVSGIPRSDWPKTTLQQVMVPLNKVTHVAPDMNIQAALKTMDQRNISHITVLDGNAFQGIITREQIHHYVRLLGELGV